MNEYANGSLAHFDICGPDESVLHAFYGGVLGWEIESKGPGYALVTPPAGETSGSITEGDTPGVVLGVVVEDLAATLERVLELGGEVTMEPVDNGWVTKAGVNDPAGNPLSLIQK
ncbi:MAG TPA: VOC family protein [Solirubrobacterales bacterium]|nr:VOC family protein [Solirubrobacterales bacterium]